MPPSRDMFRRECSPVVYPLTDSGHPDSSLPSHSPSTMKTSFSYLTFTRDFKTTSHIHLRLPILRPTCSRSFKLYLAGDVNMIIGDEGFLWWRMCPIALVCSYILLSAFFAHANISSSQRPSFPVFTPYHTACTHVVCSTSTKIWKAVGD